MIAEPALYDWLLQGDVSIQYQTCRDLLDTPQPDVLVLQNRIATGGWGARYLACRYSKGHWGRGFYQPKWTSTHYTLLDLKCMGFPKNVEAVQESVDMVLDAPRATDGGINVSKTLAGSDACVNGMILNYTAYFMPGDSRLKGIVDYILHNRMQDGGWNCARLKGATHSSLHTTLSILEGLQEFSSSGSDYRAGQIREAKQTGIEFILQHRLFRSHRTGAVIKPQFLRLSYPSRWYYDILKALDYFQRIRWPFDPRMQDALNVLLRKRRADGCWLLQAHHPGQQHFRMEAVGQPSRWNTLRALRVLRVYAVLPETQSKA